MVIHTKNDSAIGTAQVISPEEIIYLKYFLNGSINDAKTKFCDKFGKIVNFKIELEKIMNKLPKIKHIWSDSGNQIYVLVDQLDLELKCATDYKWIVETLEKKFQTQQFPFGNDYEKYYEAFGFLDLVSGVLELNFNYQVVCQVIVTL
jgi:hypothetical protein